VAIGIMLVAAACGGSPTATPTGSPSPSGSPRSADPGSGHTIGAPQDSTTGAAALPALGTTIEVGSARPAAPNIDYVDIGTIRPTGTTARFHRLAMTPDGAAFGVVVGTHSTSHTSATPALLDPGTSTITRVPWPAGHPSPKGNILYASATHRWIVWTIAVEHGLDQTPWQLYSYDRKRHVSHYLGAAVPTADGTYPTAPGYSVPSIDQNGNVYIAAVLQKHRAEPPADVVETVPADGSRPLRTIVTNAITPSAWGDDLVWATLAEHHLQFWHRDLSSGVTTKLYDGKGTDCNSEFGLVTAGHRTAWLLQCTHQGGDVLQVVAPSKATLSVRGHDLGYLELTTGYVSVAPELADGGYAQIVYNFATDQLLEVGAGAVLGDTPGSGSTLTWGSYEVGHPTEVTTHLVRLRTK
jgi:hypothetical protein